MRTRVLFLYRHAYVIVLLILGGAIVVSGKTNPAVGSEPISLSLAALVLLIPYSCIILVMWKECRRQRKLYVGLAGILVAFAGCVWSLQQYVCGVDYYMSVAGPEPRTINGTVVKIGPRGRGWYGIRRIEVESSEYGTLTYEVGDRQSKAYKLGGRAVVTVRQGYSGGLYVVSAGPGS